MFHHLDPPFLQKSIEENLKNKEKCKTKQMIIIRLKLQILISMGRKEMKLEKKQCLAY